MTTDGMTPKDIVISLMKEAVPERTDEITKLWETYDVDVKLILDAKRITLKADRDRITFDAKTMEVFWLIGFGGWKAIECYAPLVVASFTRGETVADLIKGDTGLDEVERDYKERRAAAQTLIDALDPSVAPWPPDLPRPNADRDTFGDVQYKVVFDLACMAVAFTLFHEFRHAMLDRDCARPADRREEELACDVWSREFMTAKLATYAMAHGHSYDEVLRKRSMGFALAALILYEITPVSDHGGNCEYFSIATRLQALLDQTPLPPNDHFWIFVAAILVGILRQKNVKIDAPPLSARDLAIYLLEKV